ncbi:hypothetical protein VPHK460_0213 [Vibrio phage K460]
MYRYLQPRNITCSLTFSRRIGLYHHPFWVATISI